MFQTLKYNEYDPAGRLISSHHNHLGQVTRQEYALDKEGNRIGLSHSDQHTQWTHNRVSHYGEFENRFDDAGNLIERISHTDQQRYVYDALHRLSYVERKQVGQPTLRVYYIYDALSRRIAKQVIPDRSPALLTRYGWDGDQLVHEDDGEQRITLFYEPGTFVPLFRVDELGVNALEAQGISLEQLIQENIDTSRYSAFITDHLGTPTKLIDEDGHLLWSAQADDWAAVKHERSVPNLKQLVRFQGQWLDEETGLYYNRYRYYDPKQGRYITQDPIGLAGGLNSYAYVGGNPINFIDPKGLETTVTVWQPVGWGLSSFGHVSTNINGTTYSYGPNGMSVLPTSDYLSMNDFRSGVGANLNLTPEQEARLQACMSSSRSSYNAVSNNCGTPIQDCLKELGHDLGWNVFPASVGNSLLDSGLVTGFEFYSATTPATGTSAPWAK